MKATRNQMHLLVHLKLDAKAFVIRAANFIGVDEGGITTGVDVCPSWNTTSRPCDEGSSLLHGWVMPAPVHLNSTLRMAKGYSISVNIAIINQPNVSLRIPPP